MNLTYHHLSFQSISIHSWASNLEIPIICDQSSCVTQEETEANLNQKADKGQRGQELSQTLFIFH